MFNISDLILRRVLVGMVALFAATQGAQASVSAETDAAAMIAAMSRDWKRVRTLTYRMIKVERMGDGETVREEVGVKIRRPGDIYLRGLKGADGQISEQEIIFRAKHNAKQFTVHPGGLLDFTVSIDLEGSIATAKQHHTVADSGFSFLMGMLEQSLAKEAAKPTGGRLEFLGTTRWDGRPVQRVVLHAGLSPHRRLVVPRDESLIAYAKRIAVDPYLVVYHNDGLDSISDDVDAGSTLTVPAYYGKRIELFIDAHNNMPLRISTYDFKGNLYERYEHRDLQINPVLSDLDFDPDNPAYRF